MSPYKIYDQSFFPDNAPRTDWYASDVWTKEGPDTPVTFYTDWALHHAPPRGDGIRRVAVLLEPPHIITDFYDHVAARGDIFDRVATHQRDLVERDPARYFYYPYGTTWIHDPADRRLHPKTHGVSLIASAKVSHDGHKLRHAAAAVLAGEGVELYGRGYRPVAAKATALAPFRFSVVVENCRARGFFTEKLMDALLTGTVPIYWGDPEIERHFDTAGMLVATTLEEVLAQTRRVLDPAAGAALYETLRPAVAANYQRALGYVAPDRWLVARLDALLGGG